MDKNIFLNSIRKLREMDSNEDFYFVIGADNLSGMSRWYDFQYIKENVDFIIAKRPGFNIENNSGIKVHYTLNINNETSSSEIRIRLRNNHSIKDLVPEKIEEYIMERGVYNG